MSQPNPDTQYVTVGLTKAARTAIDAAVIALSSQTGRRLSRSETIIELTERFTQERTESRG